MVNLFKIFLAVPISSGSNRGNELQDTVCQTQLTAAWIASCGSSSCFT